MRNTPPTPYTILATVALVGFTPLAAADDFLLKTDKDCGVKQFEQPWAEANVAQTTWSGACSRQSQDRKDKTLLVDGDGTLLVTLKDGRSLRFAGQMTRGEPAEGERIELDGRRFVGTVQRGGQKRYGQQYRPDGTLEFDGRMFYVGEARYGFDRGVYYASNGRTAVDGYFHPSMPGVDLDTASGINVAAIHSRDSDAIRYSNGAFDIDKSAYEERRAQLERRDASFAEMDAKVDALVAGLERMSQEWEQRRAQDKAYLWSTLGAALGGAVTGSSSEEQLANANAALQQHTQKSVAEGAKMGFTGTFAQAASGQPNSTTLAESLAGGGPKPTTFVNGWTCNSLGACALAVTNVPRVITAKDCPIVVVGWSIGPANSSLVELDVLNPNNYAGYAHSLQNAPPSSDLAETFRRAIAAHECWRDNGYTKGPSEFILKQQDSDSAAAFVSRVIGARKLAEPQSDASASGVIAGFMPSHAMPEFAAVESAEDLKFMLLGDRNRTDFPDRPQGACHEAIQRQVYRFKPFGLDLRLFTGGAQGATAREYRSAAERIPSGASPRSLEDLETGMNMYNCMETSGLPYAAEHWHFVVHDWTAGQTHQ
jgi:hypothetical protein